MEKTLVVLLLCALSSADGELSEVASQSLPCLSDIHAVLRDMTGRLAKYEVKMDQLQKDKEEQAEQLKVLLKEREKQTSRVGTVMEQQQVGQVAFSATLILPSVGELTVGPFNVHTPLVYRRVITNTGDAYNPETGIFTAPVRGVYHFDFSFTGKNQSPASAVVLVKNNEHIVVATEHGVSNGHVTGGNAANLLLEVGDTVFTRVWEHHAVYDNSNHHTSFSGHLLFTM